MRRSGSITGGALVLLCLFLAACAGDPAAPPATMAAQVPADRPAAADAPATAASPASVPDETLDALRHDPLRIAVEPVGPVPNSGLLLPTISPDGRWIAALKVDADADVYPDDLFTGRGLGDVSLVLLPVDDPTQQRTILPRGAAWPAWSADSSRLVAVTYAEDGTPRLAVHDRNAGDTRTLAPGFRHIFAPRLSPDGRTVAFSARGPEATGAHVYLFDLARRSTTAAPAPAEGGDLLFPHWRSADTLVAFHRTDNAAALVEWRIGDASLDRLAELRLQADVPAELHQSIASVAEPLSPDGRRLVYFAPEEQRLLAVDLTSGGHQPLAADSFAACWSAPQLLAIATANDLLLAFPADRSPPRQLSHGRGIPRWGHARRGHVLFLSPGDSPWTFHLLRLHVSPRSSR